MNLKSQRAAAIKAAQDIISKAQAEGRDLTHGERTTVSAKQAEVTDLTGKIDRAEKDGELINAMNGLGGASSYDGDLKAGSGILQLSGAATAKKALTTADGAPVRNVKALLTAPASVVAEELLPEVVMKERAPVSVLDVIPATIVSRDYSYLRQLTAANNAKPVAVGEQKPTSVYTLDRVPGHLRVIAHLSEAVDEYWLKDNLSLTTFLAGEMDYGLRLAVVNQILNGDGEGENMTGLAATSGIQLQSLVGDGIQTTRTALNKVELLGLAGMAFILHPNDWTAIEMKTSTTGEYLLAGAGAPIDRAKRQLWGVPVALSAQVPAGTGWLVAEGSVRLFTDGLVQLEFGRPGEDFVRNQVRARLETRADFGVLHPAGVVKMTLA